MGLATNLVHFIQGPRAWRLREGLKLRPFEEGLIHFCEFSPELDCLEDKIDVNSWRQCSVWLTVWEWNQEGTVQVSPVRPWGLGMEF